MVKIVQCHKIMSATALMLIIMWIISPVACAVTYADPNGRYEIWYPGGWDILSQPGADIVFRDNIHDDFVESINVVVDHADRVSNRESYVMDVAENTIEGMMEDHPGTTVHSEPHTYMIDGHWAVTYILDVDYQFITARQAQTIIASEGYSIIFAITCTSTPSDYGSYSSTFDRSVQSFTIVNEPESGLTNLVIAIIIFALCFATLIIFFVALGLSKKKKVLINVKPEEVKPIQVQVMRPYKPRSFKPIVEETELPPVPPPPPPPPPP